MIVDDHAFLRAGLELLLEKRGLQVVMSTGDGALALSSIPSLDPDVVILDVRMPEFTGVQFLRRFREQGHGCGIVILATDIDDSELVSLIDAHADAILFKNCAEEDLLKSVSEVAGGRTAMDRQLLSRAREVSAQRPVLRKDTLTPRELGIVDLIRQGLRNEEIAGILDIKVGSVKTHVHNILAKTGASNRGSLRDL